MSTQLTQSQSPNPLLSKGNGVDTDNQPPERRYMLEDFSQDAINRGQVEINFLLTVVNGRIGEALEQFRAAAWQLAHCGQVNFTALDHAISEVYKANRKVAGPFPPGCDLDRSRTGSGS